MKTIDSLRQCIETYYIGPTNTRGSRIVARCDARKITIPWDHSLNTSQNHASACETLATMLGWDNDLIKMAKHGLNETMIGGWRGNRCYWVFANDGMEV